MMVVQMISLMFGVDLYVIYIILCLLPDAYFGIVVMEEFKKHLPVRDINHSGGNFLKTVAATTNLEFTEMLQKPGENYPGQPNCGGPDP